MNEEAYFYGLRTIARARTMEALNQKILADGGTAEWDGTKLASVDEEAIESAENVWPKYYSDKTHHGFDKAWSSIWYHANLQPSNFNLAIWQERGGERILQGLAIGSTSEGKKHLTLNWVERNFGPDYHRFGILLPVLHCMEEYAALLGCERILIKNPIDPSVYSRYGYESFNIRKSKSDFLSKEVPYG